jgi:hypothetical protein
MYEIDITARGTGGVVRVLHQIRRAGQHRGGDYFSLYP